MPKVSVVVPTYNCAKYLGELCRSLQAQTFTDFEVIILDDGSTDDTKEALGEFLCDPRFQFLRWEKNRGVNRAHFVISTLIRGEYWCNPGADDVLHPSFLESRIKLMEANPHAGLIYGPVRAIDPTGMPLPDQGISLDIPAELDGEKALQVLLQHNIIATSSVFIRTAVTRMIDVYFDTQWRYAQDWYLWLLHVATGFDILWDEKIRTDYRVHPTSLTKSPQYQSIRKIEVRLVPLCALNFARQYSLQAQRLYRRWRTFYYAGFLKTATRMFFEGKLKREWLEDAEYAFYGNGKGRGILFEVLRHLPSVLCYLISEWKAHARQRFYVSGLASIDNDLFKKAD